MTFKNRTDYIQTLFAPENKVQKSARESLTENNDKIFIEPQEGKLLQLLIRMAGVRKIVEIGTLGGYSALWMSEALPLDGHIYTIERDIARAALARNNIKGTTNITLIEGDAIDVLKTLKGPFDMVFIDADKLHYTEYLNWAEENISTGGLIIGDNTFLFDAVWRDDDIERVRETTRKVMREFNLRLSNSEKYYSLMLDTPEGMTISIKK